MAHDVCATCCRLIGRDCEGISRIADGNGRISVHASQLLIGGKIRDDTTAVELGSGGAESKNIYQRQSLNCVMSITHHLPQIIAIIVDAGGNGLGTVDGAAAADRQDHIDGVLLAQGHALFYRGNTRVWLNAGKFRHGEAASVEDVHNCVIQADLLDRSTAVGQQHVFSIGLQRIFQMADDAFTKVEFGWNVMGKIQHGYCLLFVFSMNGDLGRTFLESR